MQKASSTVIVLMLISSRGLINKSYLVTDFFYCRLINNGSLFRKLVCTYGIFTQSEHLIVNIFTDLYGNTVLCYQNITYEYTHIKVNCLKVRPSDLSWE